MLYFCYRLIERVRKTVRGSADDIGWLQRAADMPPVEDGTERFVEILDDIRYKLYIFLFLITPLLSDLDMCFGSKILWVCVLSVSGMVCTPCQTQWFIC